MASSPIECLRKNRVDAIEQFKNDRAIEAVSIMVCNVCFLSLSPGIDDINIDLDILKQCLVDCDEAENLKKLLSDFSYAQRINAADPNSLEGEEVDLLHSLINGILGNVVAFQKVGRPLDFDQEKISWIRNFLATRGDLERSETRMSRSNPLYVRSTRLLELLKD